MFQDCADYLRNLQPMEELNFCHEIPKDEKNLRDINHFKEKLLEKKEKFIIDVYFKDSRIPEKSVLLMFVDDLTRNPKKREKLYLILNINL